MDKCANCDIELVGTGTQTTEGAYCCHGCSEGGPCGCSYVEKVQARSGNGHADPIVTWALLGSSSPPGTDGRDIPAAD
jgi:hypothetical protein